MGEFDFEKLDREVDDLLADVKGLLDEPEEDGADAPFHGRLWGSGGHTGPW